jgi:hypothetical protein
MIIRIEDSFIQLANQLNKLFLEGDKESLARSIELNYNKIFSVISDLEKSKDSKPTVIELGNVNGKYSFALNLYYYQDEIGDDIPLTIKELLPTISPVRLDLMATVSNKPDDKKQNYIKVGNIYDDGDIHSHYVNEIREEDEGLRSIDEK